MNAKIREHAMQKVPFLVVVGDKEAEAGKVNVRTRGKEKTEDMPATEFVEKIKSDRRKKPDPAIRAVARPVAGHLHKTSLIPVFCFLPRLDPNYLLKFVLPRTTRSNQTANRSRTPTHT